MGQEFEGDDLMRPRFHEADMGFALWIEAGVESCAPPPGAMSVDEVADLRRHAGMFQSADDEAALPFRIGGRRESLHGTAAADAIMRAEGGDAVGRGLKDFDELAALAFDIGKDRLAFERVGHINRSLFAMGYAFAALAEALDLQLLS